MAVRALGVVALSLQMYGQLLNPRWQSPKSWESLASLFSQLGLQGLTSMTR